MYDFYDILAPLRLSRTSMHQADISRNETILVVSDLRCQEDSRWGATHTMNGRASDKERVRMVRAIASQADRRPIR